MKQRVFISNAIAEEKLPVTSSEEIKFGRAHYSWKIVAKLYCLGLEAAGFETQRVVRPEIYQTKIARNILNLRHDDVHISVKPIEHIRPFRGMKNIFICGWEFPEFSDKAYDGNPFFNQISILKNADQIWCWSDFTTNNLKSYGINTAITMPPPVIFPKFSDDSSILGLEVLGLDTESEVSPSDIRPLGEVLDKYRGSTVFLSVLNPFDKRKQIKTMLTAFQEALVKNNNMVLIVKLVIDNIVTTLVNIQELLAVHYGFQGKSDRIVFTSETLSDDQMGKLIKIAKYYLCTSSTEGLNLPMIEAMSHGVVPVSSIATAMGDYVHEKNAIVINHSKLLTDGGYHALHSYLPTSHFPPRLSSIVDALILAENMPDDRYKFFSNRAIKDINKKYSVQAFVDKLNSTKAV